MTLVQLGIPSEIFEKINKDGYIDSNAKVRQHFRLLLVNKEFYRHFNNDKVWFTMFNLYYEPTVDKNDISIDFMKQYVRTKHALEGYSKSMLKLMKVHKITSKLPYKGGIKPHQTKRLQELIDDNRVPNDAKVQFDKLLFNIDTNKLKLSKMIRKRKNFNLVKTHVHK